MIDKIYFPIRSVYVIYTIPNLLSQGEIVYNFEHPKIIFELISIFQLITPSRILFDINNIKCI